MIRLNDLFDIEYGRGIPDSKRDLPAGNIPVISSSDRNNGVYGYFGVEPRYENVLTVARTGSVGAAFYHPYKCAITSDALVLTPRGDMKPWQALYYCEVIRSMKFKYSYGRKVTPARLGSTLVPEQVPEWAKFEQFDELLTDATKTAQNAKELLDKPIDTSDWEWLHVVNLFDVEVGSAPSIREAQDNPGDTPYVSSTGLNNGVACYTALEPKYPANTMSLNKDGSVGLAFYRDEPYVASSHVMILKPREDFLTKARALFLIPLIELNKFKYSFGRAISLDRIKTDKLKLPFKNGEIDWQWVDEFMDELNNKLSI